jgi:HlyD family secretion protein
MARAHVEVVGSGSMASPVSRGDGVAHQRVWTHWLLIGLLVVLIGAVGATLESHRTRLIGGAPVLMLAPVSKGGVLEKLTARGEIGPLTEISVSVPQAGRVVELSVSPGQSVRRGQILARLDRQAARAAASRAEAAVVAAEVAGLEAELRLARVRRAAERGGASEEADQTLIEDALAAEARLARATAEIQAREAELRVAQQQAQMTSVRSPIDGIVTAQAASLEQSLGAGGLLFRVSPAGERLRLVAQVEEAEIGKVARGQSVRFTVPAHPGQIFAGEVESPGPIGIAADGSRRGAITIAVHDDSRQLRPGMSAQVQIVVRSAPGAWRVPVAALQFSPMQVSNDGDQAAVWLQTETTLRRIPVTVGATDGTYAEVRAADLAEGVGVAVGYAQVRRN